MITNDTESSIRGLNLVKGELDAVYRAVVDVAISTLRQCGEIVDRLNEEIREDETFLEDGWGYGKNDKREMMAGDVVKSELKTLCRIAYGRAKDEEKSNG